MGPESRNQSRNPIQRLLETEEKGRGLALFGWAGVTVFAFLAAFASWQFAPARSQSRLASSNELAAAEITGDIRPSPRSIGVRGPTPLPDGPPLAKDDLEQLRSDLKDLRRMVGRIDVSTDVLARRIANLEDSIGASPAASQKAPGRPSQGLVQINPPTTMPAAISPAPMAPAQVAPAQTSAAQTSQAPTQVVMPPPAPNPMPSVLPTAPVVSASPPTPIMPQMPQPLAGPSQAAAVQPTPSVATPPANPVPTSQQTAVSPSVNSSVRAETQMAKSALDRSAVDRSALERMLLQRAQGLDSEPGDTSALLAPIPDPVSIVPKNRAPIAAPPQTASTAQPPGQPQPSKVDPQLDPATGSVTAKPPLPVDPAKGALPKALPAQLSGQMPLQPPSAAQPMPQAMTKPGVDPAAQSSGGQRPSVDKMAVAMRADKLPADKPGDPVGITLGSYRSIGQVKHVWSDLEMRQGKLASALVPLAHLSETADGVAIELVIGPFTDKEQAIRTCHQLRGAQAKCDPVGYVGQSITVKSAADATQHPPETPHRVTPYRRPPLNLNPIAKPPSETETN